MSQAIFVFALFIARAYMQDVNNQTKSENVCSDFSEIKNGQVTTFQSTPISVKIECNPGYDLVGPPKILCIGNPWDAKNYPKCVARCKPPPIIQNGALEIDSAKDDNEMFKKGTVATYTCGNGFELNPPESMFRICDNGAWTGVEAVCAPSEKIKGCKMPKTFLNGYYITELSNNKERLHFSCNTGYFLIGAKTQTCLDNGTWSPKNMPVCSGNSGELNFLLSI